MVVTLAGAGIYLATATRTYSAEAQMLADPVPPDDSTMIGLPVLHSSGVPTNDVLTAASLITTQPVAAATVSALHLRESPSALLSQIQATPVGESYLIAVQAQASSPSLAQTIANEFVKQVVATRTTMLHQSIAAILPGLSSRAATLPPADRYGPGTIGDQITQLEQLEKTADPTIRIASLASLPSGPTSPRTKLTVLAALFAGLILGIGAAFGFDALDPRLQREEQLRELFDLPILARIPREPRAIRGLPMLPEELSFGAAEGYRTLRTMLTSRAAGEARAFLVTGSSPAEGKTTSAINLAMTLAQGDARVILIEADLRRPKIADTLGLRCKYGTEDVLSGVVDLEDALCETTLDGVPAWILAVKRPGAEFAHRLSFRVAERLIKQAMELGDFVVIDSPPLTAISDALPLAQLADELLVVARIGSSRIGRLSELHDLLLEQGSYPTGIVLIGGSVRRGGYYYYEEPPSGAPNGSPPARTRSAEDLEAFRTLPD